MVAMLYEEEAELDFIYAFEEDGVPGAKRVPG